MVRLAEALLERKAAQEQLGTPPVDSMVTVRLNPDRRLPETDYTNNTMTATLEVVRAAVLRDGGTRTRLVE